MRDEYTDLIRVGKVSKIDPENCTARVIFEDREDIVSGDLPIIVPFTLKDKAYYMPSIDERVAVYFHPEAPSKGFILGSFYCDTRIPPEGNEKKTYIEFEDKTLVEYDKEEHKLKVEVPEDGDTSLEVNTESDITVKSAKSIYIESKTDLYIKSNSDIYISAMSNVNIDSGADINLNAAGSLSLGSESELNINGSMVNIN